MENKFSNKLIFLDFDGVITTYRTLWEIDNKKCEMVKHICDETGAKIVITSSWRYRTLEDTIDRNSLQDWILKDYCIGVTERFFPPEELDKEWFFPKRGMEIEKFINDYIDKNNIKDDINYVILDDDVYDLLYNQRESVVKTHWRDGISKKNAERAIKILNK